MDWELEAYNSYISVDLNKIKQNINAVKRHTGGKEIMAVIKGNAYGLGLQPVAGYLVKACGITSLACAQVSEALELRKADLNCPVLVMGGVPYHCIPAVVAFDLQTPAYDLGYLERLNEFAGSRGKTAEVHIKIETGLNRIGVKPGKDLEEMCELLKKMAYIRVRGIYTHFADAESDMAFTKNQMALFQNGVETARAYGIQLDYVHAANSAAAAWLDCPVLTHVRPAGLLFGYNTYTGEPQVDVTEVFEWKAYISNIKMVRQGESIGYEGAYTAQQDIQVATIGIGYGDGYLKLLASSGADVLLKGKRCKVIGICMDQTFVDITGVEACINDRVTIIGREGGEYISAQELQHKTGQIYLSFVSLFSGRIKRIYING